jgi:site-specific recombinase XerD
MAGLAPPKEDDILTPILTVGEVNRLIAACKGPQLEDARDEAIIRFLYDTGCRRGEVASMRLDKVNLVDGTADVTGKTVPSGRTNVLRCYLLAR